MKEQRAGVATFIPLDRIKVKPINEKLRLFKGTAKPIIDVIQYLFKKFLSLYNYFD